MANSSLDYLFGSAVDGLFVVNKKPMNLLDTLKAHKEGVERRIKNLTEKDAGIVEKHRWLVSYHDDTIERLKQHYGPEQDRFDIFAPQPMEIPDSLKIDPNILDAVLRTSPLMNTDGTDRKEV